MFFICDVLMKPDNIEESVALLDDNLITDVSRPFPNLDVMPERDRIAITLAIASYIVNKTDIDYGQDGFRDSRKFGIMINLVGRALAKEINVKIPMESLLFLELYKVLMNKKFEFLFNKVNVLLSFDNENEHSLNNELKKVITDNIKTAVSAYLKITNS